MAELLRTHPLEAWSTAFERLPDTVGIAVEPFVAMVDVRLGADSSVPVAERLASANVPFGFMTGLRDDAIPEVFKDRPVVTKPFTRQHLVNVLGALVRQKK